MIASHESKNFPCLPFRISFYVPNNKLQDASEGKKFYIQGIMEDMPTVEFNAGREIPP